MQHYDIVIIGSGFGGQCAAINLLKRGITNFRILERRDFMGGTWCQNSYINPLFAIILAIRRDWSLLF